MTATTPAFSRSPSIRRRHRPGSDRRHVPLLDKLAHNAPYTFRFTAHPGGAQHYKATGIALPPETLAAARAADAMLFGAMGWPAIRYPDGQRHQQRR